MAENYSYVTYVSFDNNKVDGHSLTCEVLAISPNNIINDKFFSGTIVEKYGNYRAEYNVIEDEPLDCCGVFLCWKSSICRYDKTNISFYKNDFKKTLSFFFTISSIKILDKS